jgi:WD40 repeat protein
MTWAPDGKTLAVGTTAGVWLYDTGQPDRQPQYLMDVDYAPILPGYDASSTGLAFSPDGSLLAFSSGNDLILWDVARDAVSKTFSNFTADVISFSPSAKWLALIDNSSTLQLINLSSGQRSTFFKGEAEELSGQQLSFSHDEKQFSAVFEYDRSVHHWDLATGDELNPITPCPQDYSIVGFSAEDNVLCTNNDHLISVSLTTKNTASQVNIATSSPVFNALASADGLHLIYAVNDGGVDTIHVWNLPAKTETIVRDQNWFGPLALRSDGGMLALSIEGAALHLWDTLTSKQVAAIQYGHVSAIRALAFGPDSTTLASASYFCTESAEYCTLVDSFDNTVRFWNLKNGQDQVIWHGQQNPVKAIAFNPDGQLLLIGTGDGTTLIWNPKTQKQVGSLRQDGQVRRMAFSPDGKILAVAADQVVLWAWPSRTRLTTLATLAFGFDSSILVFRSDNQWLAADDNLWKLEQGGRLVAEYGNLSAKVQADNTDALAWSKALISAARNQVLPVAPGVSLIASVDNRRINEVQQRFNEPLIEIPQSDLNLIAVSGDNRLIAYGDEYGVISLVGVPSTF